MSRALYDYLNDSILLNPKAVESRYDGIPEARLRSELEHYREHVLTRRNEIAQEIQSSSEGPVAYVGAAAGHGVDRTTLKRMALYFSKAVIDDPLMPHTRTPGEQNEAFARFFGYQGAGPIDRAVISTAANFLLAVRPFVGIDYLKFAPLSLAHEPPDGLVPLTFSPTLFAERIPDHLRDFFRRRARVSPLRRLERGGWGYTSGTPLEPCRAIAVEFEGFSYPMVFHLSQMKMEEDSQKDGAFTMTQWLPPDPPDQRSFDAWVEQSIYQFAGDIVRRSAIDATNAVGAQAMLLTTSDLVPEVLLTSAVITSTVESDIATLSLELSLPTVDGASEAELANLRQSYGDAFESLRLTLDRSLRAIRRESDFAARQEQLDELRHELEDTQVREARLLLERLRKSLLLDAAVGAIGLAASIPTGGLSLLGAVAAAAMGAAEVQKARQELGRNAGVFLWKLRERRAG